LVFEIDRSFDVPTCKSASLNRADRGDRLWGGRPGEEYVRSEGSRPWVETVLRCLLCHFKYGKPHLLLGTCACEHVPMFGRS
jgi:hypothetical protein